jgi:hypothetical protein
MVVSGLMGFRNMLFSVLDGFRIRIRSKKFICPLSSCDGLDFTSLYIWFVLAVIRSGCFYLFGILINQNIIYVTYVQTYVFGVEKMFVCLSLKYCRNISAPVLEIGDPTATPSSGWNILLRNMK